MKYLQLKKQLLGNMSIFAVIGSVGFFVDASVLKMFLLLVKDDPILGRVVSFPIAATVTWFLNRQYTFSSSSTYKLRSLGREWLIYLMVNGIGLAVNLSVFILVIMYVEFAKLYPIITLGLASLVALFFNYFASKYWVFGQKRLLG